MDNLRLANADEIAAIQKTSDITPQTSVVMFDNAQTGFPDVAVLRQVFEMDPVLFAKGSNTRRKAQFVWALENSFRIMGTPQAYYFNVRADDMEWQSLVKSWGAEQVSATPEFRMKKLLVPMAPKAAIEDVLK